MESNMKAWSRKFPGVPTIEQAASPRFLQARAGVAGCSRSGFTLIETIVAIGAVALVAVGLASIFDAVGKTVKGGKRVSLLNQYAGLVENQMRKDFSRMTRDGFLMIRHEWADTDQNGVFDPAVDVLPLYPDDPNPRARRCDQILFFANGKFETARQSVHPDVTVTSDSAMIYYGHGQRRRADADTAAAAPYLQPKVDDRNGGNFANYEARLGAVPASGNLADNPNYYPADWTLLRHATLLARPKTTSGVAVPGVLRFGTDTLDPAVPNDQDRLSDYDYQIGLQPAARSVFRALNRYYPSLPDGTLPPADFWFRAPRRPTLTSGIVDVAATSLREIKSIVEGFGGSRPQASGPPALRQRIMPNLFDPSSNPGLDLERAFNPWAWTDPALVQGGGSWTANNPPRSFPLPVFDLDMMHLWMEQAFPGECTMGPRFGANAAIAAQDPRGVRMRYEPQPVDLIGTLGGRVLIPDGGLVSPEQQVAMERMDQLMLAGNGFLPHCSEFVVEWSYGLVDPVTSETLWYGPEARYDSNRDGTVDTSDAYSSLPYPRNVIRPNASIDYVVEVPRLPATELVAVPPRTVTNFIPVAQEDLPRSLRYWWHRVSDRLVYGYAPGAADICTTAHFGYVDPTFKQDYREWDSTNRRFFSPDQADGKKDYGRQLDRNGSGTIDVFPDVAGTDPTDPYGVRPDAGNEVLGGEPAAASIPWAWPKMVRVTITLSDAAEPSVENTFQFVFSVPQDPAIGVQP